MDLTNINLLSLQTRYMQQDETTRALCAALTKQLLELSGEIVKCLIYARISELDVTILDELATQMRVDWYDSTAPVEIKRQLVKNAIKVHKYRGTPYAIEQVVQDCFGDGFVEEWFDYGGEPYHFRVVTSNPAVTGEQATQFAQAVETVKNIRSVLDQVIVSMSAEMPGYFGMILQTGDFITLEQVV